MRKKLNTLTTEATEQFESTGYFYWCPEKTFDDQRLVRLLLLHSPICKAVTIFIIIMMAVFIVQHVKTKQTKKTSTQHYVSSVTCSQITGFSSCTVNNISIPDA